ncbi:hypothetical protein DPMN_060853 [Dreissena polymorpha]|uniref:Uncharacterized protein n=1 Tax=Dreissena polymorpha TaxID=45954 RepID=A0A9D4HGC1_DREPO|nr:hypothetical protein DPMN_060852 [Dreissena polymorpha]KAH3718055.1 hypothetical protein DPMN_060853 [Dreissena polymorpha]
MVENGNSSDTFSYYSRIARPCKGSALLTQAANDSVEEMVNGRKWKHINKSCH